MGQYWDGFPVAFLIYNKMIDKQLAIYGTQEWC